MKDCLSHLCVCATRVRGAGNKAACKVIEADSHGQFLLSGMQLFAAD